MEPANTPPFSKGETSKINTTNFFWGQESPFVGSGVIIDYFKLHHFTVRLGKLGVILIHPEK